MKNKIGADAVAVAAAVGAAAACAAALVFIIVFTVVEQLFLKSFFFQPKSLEPKHPGGNRFPAIHA